MRLPAAGWLGLVSAAFVTAFGTLWAFQRGAGDFDVFYSAGRLVLEGRAMEIYQATPDRFLYAPGFAWLMAPWGLLPRDVALALWCFLKTAALGFTVYELGRWVEDEWGTHWSLASWSVVLCARPILIDYQYGQVNILLLAAAVWGLRTSFASQPKRVALLVLGAWSWIKLLLLPILFGRILHGLRSSQANHFARWAASGALIVVLIPLVTGAGFHSLNMQWLQSLAARGTPLESHNQSLFALATRWLSGQPVHIIGFGSEAVPFGFHLLDSLSLRSFTLAVTCFSAGVFMTWVSGFSSMPRSKWSVVLMGLIPVLSQFLVWKPYFVLSVPVFALAIGMGHWRTALLAGALMSLTSQDIVGVRAAGWLEAAGVMMTAHLLILVSTMLGSNPIAKSAARH